MSHQQYHNQGGVQAPLLPPSMLKDCHHLLEQIFMLHTSMLWLAVQSTCTYSDGVVTG
jgi:hypothetical protein